MRSTRAEDERQPSNRAAGVQVAPAPAIERLPEEAIKRAIMAGDGEMAQRMRAHDWSSTPLGPVTTWPQSLRTALSICLNSRFPIVIWWGPDLVLLYNDSWHPIVGNKHPAMLGCPGQEHFPETWDVIGPMLHGVLETGQATYSDDKLLLINKQGLVEECYYTWSYSPIPDEDGEVGGVFTAVTETTARVIGERRLRTLRDLGAMAAAVKSTEEAAWRLAMEALEKNRSDFPFALLYLLTEERSVAELIGSVGLDASSPAAAPRIHLATRQSPEAWPLVDAVAARQPLLVDGLVERFGPLPGGPWELPPERAYLQPIIASGECVAVLVTGISPRLRFEDTYQDFLHTAASHLGTAIANARAYQTERKRAEALAELDRAKTTFFSNVSHEFRTPLTLMLGPLEELLAQRQPKVENLQLVEVAHRNGTRLLKLVNTLLDFSRIEAGRVKAEYQPTDLAGFTAELASVFRSATDRAGLKLTIKCDPLSETAYVDRDMWEKIVLNLLSNAFKFTFVGEIAVCLEEVKDRVELSVRDTGVGIPAGELPRVFDRFHRVAGARGRSFEGSGIGLALVQELVKLHGGAISVQSDLGHGTTFRVSLPLGSKHLPQDRVSYGGTEPVHGSIASPYVAEALSWLSAQEPASGTEFSHELMDALQDASAEAGSARRVLLVDDNRDMRDYVQRLLSPRFEVISAANGKVALEQALKQPPDLVLTDIMMPEMDGFQLLAALRANPATCAVPIILLSARAGDEARIEGMQQGADDYLIKPFSARELLARVQTHIELSHLRRQAMETVRESEEEFRILHRIGETLASELDLKKLVQAVTDAGRELSQAQFGAFFYNVVNPQGESYMLYTLSGAPAEAFNKFPMPRNTRLFGPTFAGEGTMRIDDVLQDPRYGHSPPYHGMPPGHLPVRSYLSAPVKSRSGEVLGGLFYGHSEVGVFTERAERLVEGIAKQAAVAIDNARLFESEKTERHHAEESEKRLRAIVDTSPECVKIVAPDGTLLYMNSAGLAMVGAATEQQALGKNVYDLMVPEDRERYRAFNERICRGERASLEFEIIGFKGVRRYMDSHAAPLRYHDGTIVHLAVTRDITERKRSEGEMRRRGEQFETVLNQAPIGVYLVDTNFRIRQINPVALPAFGLDDVIGRNLQDVMRSIWPREHADEIVRIFRHTLETGESYETPEQAEYRIDRKMTEHYAWRVDRIPLPEGDYGVVCYFRDISAEVHARTAIQEQEERMHKMERMAAAGKLAASLAHEINNPLSSVTNALYLLENYVTLDPAARAFVTTATGELARVSRIVHQSLSYHRIGAQPRDVDVAQLVNDSLQIFGDKFRRAGVTLKQKIRPGSFVFGISDEIRQVVDNLLLNAVEAMPNGGQVTVSVHPSVHWNHAGQRGVRVTVADSGPGIPRDLLSKIFEPFFTTKAEKGTGLGLWVLHGIVSKHDGVIRVKSSEGAGRRGAVFSVFLPSHSRAIPPVRSESAA